MKLKALHTHAHSVIPESIRFGRAPSYGEIEKRTYFFMMAHSHVLFFVMAQS